MMDPVVFGRCFGWLHNAEGSKGIVMCSPLGFEELGTRRSWRNLAESFASQGMPTLRFDYDGINDSLGVEEDSDRVTTWTINIIEAVKFLRATCNVNKIALVGLRFGATLAALAALELEDIDELVLIAPVVTGRSYVRELRLVADAWWAAASPMSHKEHTLDYVDVIGNRFYAATLDAFNKIDLRKLRVRLAKKLLILDPGRRPDIAQLSAKLAPLHTVNDYMTFDGLDDFLRDSVLSKTPQAAFDNICKWLGNGGEAREVKAYTAALAPAQFLCQDFKETALKFGEDHKLFGILTEPIDPSLQYPAVMILNTGPNLHVGNGRLSVMLSRYLSLLGVASLRFDLSGIGESDEINGRGSSLYTMDALEDVRAAADILSTISDKRGIVIVGLCSGAFLGFHAAVNEARISGAVIVNLQRFIWEEGTSLQVAGKRTKRSTRFYVRAAMRKATWIRIAKGEGDVFSTLVTLAIRPFRRIFSSNRRELDDNLTNPGSLVKKWTRRLSDDGKHIRFWYSEDDPGLSELEMYFGSSGKGLTSLPHIDIGILPGADHSLNSYAARKQFIAMFEAYLREGYNQEIPVGTPV